MPICFYNLSCNLFRLSRNPKTLVLFLIFGISNLASSQSLTGLWIGAVSNDSTTVRKDQSFEIALTEYRGKVYGYSRSEFIVDDALYYIVKRVEGTIEGDVCEVTDDEIVACNFPKRPDKGVKVTSTFRRNGDDGQWYLDGTWKTNKTKNYYSITGKVSLAEEKDLTASKIFPHLEELKIAEEVAFYKERKEGVPIVKLVKPERDDMASVVNPNLNTTSAIEQSLVRENTFAPRRSDATADESRSAITNSIGMVTATSTEDPLRRGAAARDNTSEESISEPEKAIAKTDIKDKLNSPAITDRSQVSGSASHSKIQTNNEADPEMAALKKLEGTKTQTGNNDVVINNSGRVAPASNPSKTKAIERPEITTTTNNPATHVESQPAYQDDMNVDLTRLRKQESTQTTVKPVVNTEKTTVNTQHLQNNTSIELKPIPKVSSSVAERRGAAALVNERRTDVSQVVEFRSDSLQIALYDNGQVDGDTVSILMNGEVMMSRVGLKATAIRHTIHLQPGQDEFHIVLYAENLGTLPPNTGLLVVRDGTDVYNLRFSADFQKNTGIVFRRKK